MQFNFHNISQTEKSKRERERESEKEGKWILKIVKRKIEWKEVYV